MVHEGIGTLDTQLFCQSLKGSAEKKRNQFGVGDRLRIQGDVSTEIASVAGKAYLRMQIR